MDFINIKASVKFASSTNDILLYFKPNAVPGSWD
jgi:hypothetical protein